MWINAAYQAYVLISLHHAAGGQAPVRRARKKREGGSKKRRRSAHVFVDDAAGHSSLAEGLPEGQETTALPSESEQSDYSETSQESQAPSDHFIDPEDGYDEADVADLRDAEAAAAEADLLSQDSALWRHESREAGSPQERDTALPQALGSRPKGGVRLPNTPCLPPTGCCNLATMHQPMHMQQLVGARYLHSVDLCVTPRSVKSDARKAFATGAARPRKRGKVSKALEELESLKAWAGENPEYVWPPGTPAEASVDEHRLSPVGAHPHLTASCLHHHGSHICAGQLRNTQPKAYLLPRRANGGDVQHGAGKRATQEQVLSKAMRQALVVAPPGLRIYSRHLCHLALQSAGVCS